MDMKFRRYLRLLLLLSGLALLPASGVRAGEASKPAQLQVAALASPFGARADWQQWDSFFTNVVKKLAENLQPAQRDQLSEVFLDARYQLVQAALLGSVRSGAAIVRRYMESFIPDCKTSDSRGCTADGRPIYEFHSSDGRSELLKRNRPAVRDFSHYAGRIARRSATVGRRRRRPLGLCTGRRHGFAQFIGLHRRPSGGAAIAAAGTGTIRAVAPESIGSHALIGSPLCARGGN